jgi:hypothetical protein
LLFFRVPDVSEELIDGLDDADVFDDRAPVHSPLELSERLSHACFPPVNL